MNNAVFKTVKRKLSLLMTTCEVCGEVHHLHLAPIATPELGGCFNDDGTLHCLSWQELSTGEKTLADCCESMQDWVRRTQSDKACPNCGELASVVPIPMDQIRRLQVAHGKL